MTFLALGAPLVHEVLVVEDGTARQLDIPLGRLVAQGAAPDGVQLPGAALPLEVTQEARGLRHLDVGPDDDLGVATRAAELPAAARLLQVRPVIEDDAALEGDLAL